MTIRKFLIDICGIFLGVSLASSIEELIKGFSVLALCSFIIVIFLSINFFFAKVKQLNEEDEVITTFGLFIHIVTLACFAAMAFALNNFILFISLHIGMRVSDLLLIMSHNKWKAKNVEKMEARWILFDLSYAIILVAFIVITVCLDIEILKVIFVITYLIMCLFESLFDFLIHRKEYGLVSVNTENDEKNILEEESE